MSDVKMAGITWRPRTRGGFEAYLGRGTNLEVIPEGIHWRVVVNFGAVGDGRCASAEEAAQKAVDRVRDDALALLLATGVDALAVLGKVGQLREQNAPLPPDDQARLAGCRRFLNAVSDTIRSVAADFEPLVRADERAKILAEIPTGRRVTT